MDVNDLLVFVRVVQAGSFSKASKILGMPKSTVSRRVADLESALGIPLLHRTTRSLRITDVGNSYFQHGLKIAAELEQAEALLTSLQSVPQGTLKLTAPTDFGTRFLGKSVSEFLKANPRVSADIVLTERVVDLISEGFDLAIRIGALEDSSLMARKIGNIEMQLWASPDYLKEKGEPKSCAELEKHSCILFTGEEEQPSQWRLQGPRGASSVIKTRGRISSNNIDLVRDFAIRGEGIALLPYFHCSEDLKKDRLQPVLDLWYFDSGPIHAVFPGQRYLLPKVRAFVEHLLAEFTNFNWRYRNARDRG
ncbi:MAG: LysR family transcriptional regulator [Oligoflexia bacterium]|nr:LysR family transcriptional regulator [Oligoflexia bacterium]